jgi:hypothetical protein
VAARESRTPLPCVMSPISSAKVLLQRSGQCEGLATLDSKTLNNMSDVRLSADLVAGKAVRPILPLQFMKSLKRIPAFGGKAGVEPYANVISTPCLPSHCGSVPALPSNTKHLQNGLRIRHCGKVGRAVTPYKNPLFR